jgi:predicted dehydrogenase/phosphoglycolate phosphatase-like HAD superfamily hydrolase
VIFLVDLDGPILDVREKYFAVYEAFLRARGGPPPLSKERFWSLKRLGASGTRILAENGAGGRQEAAELDRVMREEIETEPYLALDTLQPGVPGALARLKAAGFRLVLVSLRKRRDGVLWQLDRFGLSALFEDVLVGEGNLGLVGEKRDLVRNSLGGQLGPADMLVGDTELDVAVARALGVRAIAVSSGLREEPLLRAANPDVIADSLEAAVDLALREERVSGEAPSGHLGLAVVGFGNWGPRVARNFAAAEDADLRLICDVSEQMQKLASRQHPRSRTTGRLEDVIEDPAIHAVYVATPVATHESIVRRLLEAGKDVLVEKPLTGDARSARLCVQSAAALGRILMVGHTFVYSPPVRRIREIVQSGELGRVLYVESSRVNLGLFQKDVSVIWDLAPHDLSIVLYSTGKRAVAVSAHGKSFFGANNLEDVAMLTVEFEGGMLAYIQISWLAPVKLRRTTIVGDRKMIVYDDLEPVEKVKLFDRRVERPNVTPTFGEFQLTYRFGDVVSPVLDNREPLALETKAFIDAVRTRTPPESDSEFGLQIVEILEGATVSLHEGGRFVRIG